MAYRLRSDVIPDDLERCFHPAGSGEADKLKKGLEAIIDLSENDRIELIDEQTLASAMQSFKSDLDAAKLQYFGPAFESIFPHQGTSTPEQFMELLKNGSRAPAVGAPISEVATLPAEPSDSVG
ncbi:hypothetical protein GWC77_09740 [Paraburkholderia sp. NMBU_R16]|uniref:hypothetical protein n=1 Tax=Paraburkholderia sp. NMBU_R16 TaxID=2698676 RepID=UPI001566C0CE|nr:hypothetical protein [Paraburkholderia sp. NMBU_R16]NRO96216.1 hypothetical protein [Paraburkholderia sp. NMBU_R16]